MKIIKNNHAPGREYTVTYQNMRGVDFSSGANDTKRYRFSYAENMYKDYDAEGGGIIESIPGFRKLISCDAEINGIYSHKDDEGNVYVVIHSGTTLKRFPLAKLNEHPEPPCSTIGVAPNVKSRGFTSGTDLYILFGGSIAVVDKSGTCKFIGDASSERTGYVPTTYINGVEYEQRNLLTSHFLEKYKITSSDKISAANEHLKYRIISEEECTCAVVGIEDGHSTIVRIPSQVEIGGKEYSIYEISDMAFKNNQGIKYLYIANGPKRIGKMAFLGCEYLELAMMSDSIEEIDNGAFSNCFELTKLHLGKGIQKFGLSVFSFCSSLTEIDYALDEASFALIKNGDAVGARTINYGINYANVTVSIPIFSPAVSLIGVSIDGKAQHYTPKTKNGLVYAVEFTATDRSAFDGKEVLIAGNLDDSSFTKNSTGSNFIEEEGAKIDGKAAVLGCTVCCAFDGRIFLSGNPALPNTVFYSSRDT